MKTKILIFCAVLLVAVSAWANHFFAVSSDGGLGPELLANNSFTAWTGDDPDSWALSTAEDATHYVTEDANGARYFSGTTTPALYCIQYNVLTVGKSYRVVFNIHSIASGSVKIIGGFTTTPAVTLVGTTSFDLVASGTGFQIGRNAANTDVVIRSISIKEIL